MKKFAVFDIDGTLIRWQLYHAIADTLAKHGLIDPKTYDDIRAARMLWKRRSEPFKSYEQRLVDAYEKILTKLTTEQFEQAADAVFEEYKDQVYIYTRGLVGELKRKGYLLFAISGSQQEIVARIADYYGFDACVGSEYERRCNAFSGVKRLPLGNKDTILKSLAKRHGASFRGSIAVGDSTSDIAMLELVEQPIAFNPERALFEHAKSNHWRIVIERKNMVYSMEWRNGSYVLV